MTLHFWTLLWLTTYPMQDAAQPRLWSAEEVVFIRRPQPEFPARANSSRGEVATTCVVTDRGTFRSCRIEAETPSESGFGRAALVAMQRGTQIEMSAGGPVEGDHVRSVIRFRDGN